ncbi:MAG: MFS transporter [Pelagimonas sp.]|jgi:MFS family permease|nr:MFS transporter [Pelagimonas sp.]
MTNIAATRWIFFLQPLILGAWFPRIPQVQDALGLSAGQLAFALMGMPLGLLTALAFGARLAEALGTRRLLMAAALTQGALFPLPAFAWSGESLFALLAIAGLALALAELGLNVTASEVEARSEAHIMNGCHGFWSLGVLAGSILGVLSASFGIAPGISLLGVSLVMTPVFALIGRGITDYAVPAPEKRGGGLSRPLVLISLFAFGIALSEGAMADWSAVYLTDEFAASPGLAGAGYTVFALFVAAARFLGDPLKARMAVEKLAIGFSLVALVGVGFVVAAPQIGFGFLGIALLGFGVALGFPLAVSAVSALPGRSSAGNVAILTQMALCGFLVGPPMIGLIAEHSSMRVGLGALVPVLLITLVLARQLRARA